MTHLDPTKLHVSYIDGIQADDPIIPRAYTLTHSDRTGDLYLTIGFGYNRPQISGIYTRFMRDEVLAEWREADAPTLHVHCHVSGGLVFGFSRWRSAIFRYHLPMVLEAFRYGDQRLVNKHPYLSKAHVLVHFHAWQKRLNRHEVWGTFDDYLPQIGNGQSQ